MHVAFDALAVLRDWRHIGRLYILWEYCTRRKYYIFDAFENQRGVNFKSMKNNSVLRCSKLLSGSKLCLPVSRVKYSKIESRVRSLLERCSNFHPDKKVSPLGAGRDGNSSNSE